MEVEHVPFKAKARVEALVAYRTPHALAMPSLLLGRPTPLRLVVAKVELKIGHLNKITTTVGHRAFVRTFTCVNPNMRLQMRLLLKAFITIKTCVFSDVGVDQHVLTKQSLGSEYFEADGATDVGASQHDGSRHDGHRIVRIAGILVGGCGGRVVCRRLLAGIVFLMMLSGASSTSTSSSAASRVRR